MKDSIPSGSVTCAQDVTVAAHVCGLLAENERRDLPPDAIPADLAGIPAVKPGSK